MSIILWGIFQRSMYITAWLMAVRIFALKVKWSTGKAWKIFLEDSHFVDFQLKVYYICTMTWEGFTSVVLNRCVIWNRNVTSCRHWSATPKPLHLIQSHICICVSILIIHASECISGSATCIEDIYNDANRKSRGGGGGGGWWGGASSVCITLWMSEIMLQLR